MHHTTAVPFWIGLALVAAACGGSNATAPTEQETPLSYLALSPDSFATVVGGAVTLQVTARDLSSVDVPDLAPNFSTTDPAVVRIEGGGLVVGLSPGTATVRASWGGQIAEAEFFVGDTVYDLAGQGPPRVLDANYIDLSKITRISRFRSTVGHSYVDASGETCRSMKHYYEPKADVDWTSVDVYAPTSGSVLVVAPDGAAGDRVLILSRDLPVLQVQLFHVTLDPGIVKNAWVSAGQHIGTHASSTTTSDIAVSVGGKEVGTLLSYFETMTDDVFAAYQARGVSTRESAIITKEERDADPVPCVGEEPFTQEGTIPDWLDLS